MKKSKQHVKYMNREVAIHKQLSHENIVQVSYQPAWCVSVCVYPLPE